MRMRDGDGERAVFGSALGNSTPSIILICALSAWPAPTTVFFT